MINNIKNYFKQLKKDYDENPKQSITQAAKIALILILTAGLYPITHFGTAIIIKTLSKVLIPILSLGTSLGLGLLAAEIAGPKIADLVEYMLDKFSAVRKNIPTTKDEFKQAVSQTYNSIPPFATVKAMLFSAVTPATSASNQANAQDLTGLNPKQKPKLT